MDLLMDVRAAGTMCNYYLPLHLLYYGAWHGGEITHSSISHQRCESDIIYLPFTEKYSLC